MKISICTFLAVFLFTAKAFSQEDFKPKLGLIDRASLEMTAYPEDSTADAVFLYDYGNVQFSYVDQIGLVMIAKFWVRIKILKESALDRASVSIPYGESGSFIKDETISDIEGYTYNLVGNKIETTNLTRKSIIREKISSKYYGCKFNLQNVRKGSVIEYSYTKTTPLNFKDKPDTWTFQSTIPAKWSEYNITIPNMLYYKINMAGYVPLYISKRESVPINIGTSRLNGDGMAYRLVVKNSPAFSNESFITTPGDYVSKISFELSSISIPGETVKNYSQEWKDVDRTLLMDGGFGGQLKKFAFIKEIKAEIVKKSTDPTEKMNLAYAYIQQNIKWDGNGGLASKDGVKKAFENKKGNVSDINLMLTGLLRELDIEADPLVLSTRSNGRVFESIPLLEGFDYVVSHVKIGEKTFLLDATQRNTVPGVLPEFALAGIGRIVPEKNEGSFINLTPKLMLSRLEKIEADISPVDGTLKGKYSISLGGYEALRWRDKYVLEPESTYSDLVKKQNPEWEIDNFKVNNKNERLSESVEISYDFEIDSDGGNPETFYFNPMLTGRIKENPFKAPTRIYPVDFTAGSSTSFMGNFKIPDGYYIEEIPKVEIITLPEKAGKFAYQIKQNENMISVNSIVMLNRPSFSAEEYELLREFYDRIVKKHAQPLVLKKKK
ncbi:transglutaminase domain-containing protein [Dyadobacter subterraneus]|uniref:DUF3857 domain-containing protein n=1 Tax=Dyadobacter subterraneus TaxID=2773304 RepID=A0ABR9WIT6_9BACT|nr:DUF3857 domain-containing protein [Dyadobacter subterraneus]MBE9465433.1 DUF3857 domain-containing protein [Dyadobacter subterraneus]